MNNDYLLPAIKKEKSREYTLSMIAFFVVLFIIDYFLQKHINTDTFTLGIWAFLCIVLFLKHLKFFIKYIVYIFGNSINLLGVFVIENNFFYLYELGTYSARNNSLFLITMTHCFFMLILLLFDTYVEKRLAKHKRFAKLKIEHKKLDNCILYFFAFLFFSVSLYMLAKAIANPASRHQLDRFVYQKTYITGLWDIFHSYAMYLIPIFVIISFRKRLFLSVFSILLYCIYMYLVGNKFGVFLSIIAFFLPFIVEYFKLQKISVASINKIIIIAGVLVLCMSLVLYSFMNKTYGLNKQSFMNYIYDRLAQQGQMWWAVYGKEQGAGFHFDQLRVSLGSFFGIDRKVIDQNDYGIYKMMKLVTPYSIYQAKMDSGSRYSTSTQATLYYYFKTYGLLGFTGMLALLISYITNWYWREIRASSWFGSIISGYFYTLVLAVYSQSDFNILFSKRKFLLALAFILIRKICLSLGSATERNANQMQKGQV